MRKRKLHYLFKLRCTRKIYWTCSIF